MTKEWIDLAFDGLGPDMMGIFGFSFLTRSGIFGALGKLDSEKYGFLH